MNWTETRWQRAFAAFGVVATVSTAVALATGDGFAAAAVVGAGLGTVFALFALYFGLGRR